LAGRNRVNSSQAQLTRAAAGQPPNPRELGFRTSEGRGGTNRGILRSMVSGQINRSRGVSRRLTDASRQNP
jgi:hypothetical protein